MTAQGVSVVIAPSGSDRFEVRLIGPGGWRTTCSGVGLGTARHDAWALAQVLQVEVEDRSEVAPYDARTMYPCGHPRTSENTQTVGRRNGVRCKICRRRTARESLRRKREGEAA